VGMVYGVERVRGRSDWVRITSHEYKYARFCCGLKPITSHSCIMKIVGSVTSQSGSTLPSQYPTHVLRHLLVPVLDPRSFCSDGPAEERDDRGRLVRRPDLRRQQQRQRQGRQGRHHRRRGRHSRRVHQLHYLAEQGATAFAVPLSCKNMNKVLRHVQFINHPTPSVFVSDRRFCFV
jgi:hypothetical protein